MTRVRLALLAGAFVAILTGRFEPLYLRVFASEREAMRATLQQLRFRKTPGLEQFLDGVRERTRDGDSIALVLPMRDWSGYSYAYYRASYVLVGRRVVPLMQRDDVPQPQNLSAANVVAAWQAPFADANFETTWSSPDGTLSRRRR